MQQGGSVARSKSYRVSCQQGDRLVVLEALAKRWVQNPLTKERAEQAMSEHNSAYNQNGEYWAVERTVSFDIVFIAMPFE